MKTNEAAKAIIKHAEGLKLDSYKCPAGIWTIGYGHTGADICEGLTISDDGAEVLLANDLATFERGVSKMLAVPATGNQFSAMVCFSYNVGLENLRTSTLLRKFNAGDVPGSAAEFEKWNKAGGKVLPGLVTRRAAERALFLTPDVLEA